MLTDADLRPRIAVDAVVAGTELGLALCEELGRLAPFGLGNPGVTLLVDGCELDALSTVGDGKHLRFRVSQRGRDAGAAIAFGLGGQLDRLRRPGRYDVAFRLQENRWNGTVSPQLVVRRVFDASERFEELRHWLGGRVGPRRGGVEHRRARDLRGARAASATERGGAACSSRPRSGACSTSRRRSPLPRSAGLPAAEHGAAAGAQAPLGRHAVRARVELEQHAGDAAELSHVAAATEHGAVRFPVGRGVSSRHRRLLNRG